MEETRAEQPASHRLHMAVNHVTGTVGARMVKGLDETLCFGTQLIDSLKRRAADRRLRPLFKRGDSLAKLFRVRGMINIPNALFDVGVDRLQRPFTAVSYL